MKRSCRAFTLVELLVVISIIALLLSVLMPALSSVRRQAKKVVCKSNMKQLGLAVNIYAQNYNNALPVERYFDTRAGYDLYWFNELFTSMPQLKGMICPSHPWPDRKMGVVLNGTICGGGYGLNDELDWVSQWSNAPRSVMKMGNYKNPSQIAHILEAGWDMNPRVDIVVYDLICVDAATFAPTTGFGDGTGLKTTGGTKQVDCTRSSGNRNLRADHARRHSGQRQMFPMLSPAAR
jgi:prepilin-type N-terminal cleavage/methylation domain-containing protein